MFKKIDIRPEKYTIPGMSKQSVVIVIAISILFIVLSLCMTFSTRPIEEDAFITFRHVENFFNGNGFVFNASERVEGISNFSWAVMLAILSRCGFPFLPTSAMVGLGFAILTIWTLWLFSVLYLKRGSYFQFIAPLLLATDTSYLLSCTNGLETAFYTFLITVGTISFVHESREKETFPYSAIILSLASMTRPEAPLLFIGMMFILIGRDVVNRSLRRNTLLSGLTFFLIYGSFIIFRIYYYQDIFPNTVYYKSSVHFLFKRNPTLLFDFFVSTKSYFVFFPALFLLFKTSAKKTFYQIAAVIAVGIILMFFLTEPQPRFIVPLLPLSFILVQEGLFQFSRILEDLRIAKRRYKEGFVFFLVVSILLTNLLWHEVLPYPFTIGKVNPLVGHLKRIYAEPSILKRKCEAFTGKNMPRNNMALFGDWIRRNLPKNSIIVYDQMGQTPFYAGLSYTFIDAWGITDRVIAEIKYRKTSAMLFKIKEAALELLPGVDAETYQKDLTYLEYILSRDPDYIFINVPSLHTYLSSDEFNHRYQKFFPNTPQTFAACYRKKPSY